MTFDLRARQRLAYLEKRVLDLHARVRFLSGSTEPRDVMDRHCHLDLICRHLSEIVSMRRAVNRDRRAR
jgi:hypothetical protein